MIKCRSVVIGKGQPKICLPIVETNDKDILEVVDSFNNLP